MTPFRGTVGPSSTRSTPFLGTDVTSSTEAATLGAGFVSLGVALKKSISFPGLAAETLSVGPSLQLLFRHLI